MSRISQPSSTIGILASAAATIAAMTVYNVYRARKAEREHPPAGQFVTVDGVRLHYIERGEGPPVVLLHGNVVTAEDFDTSGVLDLVAKRHRVIAFDRPGFGYSDRPHGSAWSAGTQAELIRDAFAVLGINRPIVLGHSWGAAVALALGLNHPDAVRGTCFAVGLLLSDPPRRRAVLGADRDPNPRRFAALFSLPSHWQSNAATPAQGDVRPAPRAGTFHEELSPRHVCTTRANSRAESRRRRDDPGRPSHAASLSRTVDANRYHGRHEGSRRKGQPSRSASRGNSAQCPPADSRCWTHGSLCGSRRGRESDRGSRETSDDVPPHWASLCLLHGVRSIGRQPRAEPRLFSDR